MANLHELREIAFLIGKFIPVWLKGRDDYYEYRFYPKDLLNCCFVCRAWRSAMLPWLWVLFEETKMGKVPNDILLKYSPYFKIIGYSYKRETLSYAIIHAEGLRDIKISYMYDDMILPVLNTHPGLRSLSISSKESHIDSTIVLPLGNLSSLVELEIGSTIMTFQELAAILENKPKLQTLSLDSIEINDEPPEDSSNLELPGLTALHITSTQINQGVIHRLLECSPALRTFTLYLNSDEGFQASECVNVLRRNNPNLESLLVQDHYSLEELDVMIEKASPLVKDICVDVDCLEVSTFRAIASRADTLEKLTIKTGGAHLDMINLSRCTRLRELHILVDNLTTIGHSKRIAQILCDKSWSNPNMTHFSIRGLRPQTSTAAGVALPQGWIILPADDLFAPLGRTFPRYSEVLSAQPLISGLDAQLLETFEEMAHIQEVVVNELKYKRLVIDHSRN
ncbi:hypothetical protein BGZ80_010253 [Entomortierella chlamydospora]|uniref:F-box domain-containing protein n=1 Tax=Entomortierella chlamydospora TaxID=101097 RepID=A0A9P6T010_9FUNG|nr:hypothetical protein BGZ80_010253 [Entomortierella chlamydospora]